MGDEVGSLVDSIVRDAADEAAESVREEHAVEAAAERVEDAAERVEAAAASAHEANTSPALTRDDLHAIMGEHLAPLHARIDALETPAPAAEDVAQQTAEATVEEIAERVEEQAEHAEDELEHGVELPSVETPSPDAVAEVVDADVPPRKTHFMHRNIFGG